MAYSKTARRVTLIVVVALAVASAFKIHQRTEESAAAHGTQPAAHQHRGSSSADGAPVPVDVAPVTARDLPVYLSGLGTVQAFNTVTVRPQVSGQLLRVLFNEGDEVEKGQLLAEIDPRTFQAALDQANAKLAQDMAQLRSAQTDLRRFQDLAPQGYVSGQQLDQQQQLVAQYQAAVAADRAVIQSDAVQLSYTRITAPIAGRLGMRLVDAGNIVSASDAGGIVVVTQLKPISVVFTLPEQNLEAVLAASRQAGVTQLQVQALDRANNTVLATGTLSAVDNQINTATGTVELKARFANADERLWPGQFVNIRLRTRTLTQVPTVPELAVQQGPSGAYVYRVKADDTVEMQAIETGITQGGFTQITHGLSLGDPIVVDGQYRLKPGVRVKAHTASGSTAPPSQEPVATSAGGP